MASRKARGSGSLGTSNSSDTRTVRKRMLKMKSGYTRAFTLVELLTVIAIIGILAGIILPAMRRAKEKAKIAQCTNNLMQFSRAIDLFRVEHDDDFPDWLSNLYPSYIDSKQVYLCPADYCTQGTHRDYSSHVGADGGKPWWDKQQFPETDDTKYNNYFDQQAHPRNSEISRERGDTVDYCSYLYEFCGAPCPWRLGYTWKEARIKQMTEGGRGGVAGVGGRLPIVRCFWHQKRKPGSDQYASNEKDVLNVAVGHKNVYNTNASEEK